MENLTTIRGGKLRLLRICVVPNGYKNISLLIYDKQANREIEQARKNELMKE